MGLTKIHGWKGEAEILGGLYEVEFERGTLVIKGLDLDTSYAVLETLAAKTIVAVRVGRQAPPVQETAPAKAPAKAAAPAPVVEPKKDTPPWDPKVEFPDEPASQPAKMMIDTPAGQAAVKAINQGMAPAKEELAMEEEKPAPKAETVEGVPPEIQNAPNVVSILDWIVNTKGVSSKDTAAMVKAVQEIAPHVGLLRRMGAKLPERITSTLQMYLEGGG